MIQTLRSLLFYAAVLPATMFFSTAAIILLPLPRSARYHFITRWSVFALWWLKVTCGLSWTVVGRENIPDSPGVILCKHQSAWETMALQLVFSRQVQVVKRELLLVPFFGWGLATLNVIAIDRSAGATALRTVLRVGAERIADGWWVLLFPEGTRVKPGAKRKYSQSGAALALKSGACLVPVAHNAGVFWPRNSLLKKPGLIEAVIGPPIETTGKSAGEITREAEAWIEETSAKLLPQAS